MALSFDTTTGTSPASWYPLSWGAPGANPAAAAVAPPPSDLSFLFPPAPVAAAPAPTAAPAPSLYAPAPSYSPSDFASLFPYLKLGLSGAGTAGLPGTGFAGGLLNLGTGAATGNPAQIGQGALGTISGANALFNSGSTLGGTLAQPVGTTLSTAMPAVATGLNAVAPYVPLVGAALTGLMADLHNGWQGANQNGQITQAIMASILPALMGSPIGAFAGPVLGVAMAANQALNPPNYWPSVAKLVTGMEENSLRGMTQAGSIFDQMKAAGITDPSLLERALTMGSNALFPSYQKIDVGGVNGPAGVSDYFAHTKADPTAYTAAQTGLQNDLWNTILGLHNAGVPNTTLGALPAKAGWGDSYLGGMPVQQAAVAAQPGGAPTFMFNGMPMSSGQLSNPVLANLGSGVSPFSTAANNSVTGGPLMSMTAALNPSLYGQIGGGYNFSTPAAQEALAAATNPQYHPAYQDLSGPQA